MRAAGLILTSPMPDTGAGVWRAFTAFSFVLWDCTDLASARRVVRGPGRLEWIGLSADLPVWTAYAMPALAALLVVTIVNRVRRGLAEGP